MRRRGPIGLCLVVLSAGCGASDVFLPPPPDVGAEQAVFLAIQGPNHPLRVVAATGGAHPLLSLDTNLDEPLEITALTYASGLDALEVEAGALTAVPEGRCGARSLPAPAVSYQVSVDGGGAGPWTRLDTLPAALEAYRFAGACACHDFEVVITQPIDGTPRLTLPDPLGAKVVYADGTIARIDRTGLQTMLGTGPPGVVDGVEAPDGELWLARGAEVWRGTPDGGFTLSTTVSAAGSLRAVDGGAGVDGFELFGTTNEGEVLQLAPGPAQLLSVRPEGRASADQLGRVVWLGPGEVVAAEHNVLSVVRIRDGLVLGRATLPENARGAQLLGEMPAPGLVAISSLSPVYFIEGFEVKTTPSPSLEEPQALIPFFDGFLYTGEGGYLQEWQDGEGFCETFYVPGTPRFQAMFPLEDLVGVVGVGVDTSLTLTILEPQPAEP